MVCEIHQIVRIPQDWTGERNGRTLFAPTVICADIASVNRQKWAVEDASSYMVGFVLIFVLWVGVPQNRPALCGFYIVQEDRKAVQFGFFDTAFVQVATLQFFFYYSAPLGRLSPIEALPQTPQGLCPLTPQAL